MKLGSTRLNKATSRNDHLCNSASTLWKLDAPAHPLFAGRSSPVKMRLLSPICLLLASITSLVLAKSAAGDKLLVVLEDESQKSLYSKFWADLECMHTHHGRVYVTGEDRADHRE
jgi:hypothetical protein